MRVVIVGGKSSLAAVLKPMLLPFAEVITAGRSGCDIEIDLSGKFSANIFPGSVDAMINTAAHFGGTDFSSMAEAERVNVAGTLNLCHAGHEIGVKHFISISSINALLDESSEYFGSYALTKRFSDEMAKLYCKSVGMPFTILRPSQLYGEEDGFRKHQLFLYTAIDRAANDQDIVIFGPRNALRNFINADDLCRIILQVLTKGVYGTFTCTHPVDVSLLEIAETVNSAFGGKGRVVFKKDMKPISDNVFPFDNSLYKEIGFQPEVTLAQGIRRIANRRLSRL